MPVWAYQLIRTFGDKGGTSLTTFPVTLEEAQKYSSALRENPPTHPNEYIELKQGEPEETLLERWEAAFDGPGGTPLWRKKI